MHYPFPSLVVVHGWEDLRGIRHMDKTGFLAVLYEHLRLQKCYVDLRRVLHALALPVEVVRGIKLCVRQ